MSENFPNNEGAGPTPDDSDYTEIDWEEVVRYTFSDEFTQKMAAEFEAEYPELAAAYSDDSADDLSAASTDAGEQQAAPEDLDEPRDET
jgi:hypothetical protein